MNSVPKLIPGAKHVAAATAREGHGRAKPGDAFMAMLDKAGGAAAPRGGRHTAIAEVALPTLDSAIRDGGRNGRATLADRLIPDVAEKDDAVDGASAQAADAQQDATGQGAAIPVAVTLPPAVLGAQALTAPINVDSPPPVQGDAAAADGSDESDIGAPRTAKPHQGRGSSDAVSSALKPSPANAQLAPAAAATPVAGQQPDVPPATPAASALSATTVAAEPEMVAPPPVLTTVVRYRTYAPPEPVRPLRSPGTDRIASFAVESDPDGESAPADKAPRRSIARLAPDFPAASVARPAPLSQEPTVDEGAPQAAAAGGASPGLPAATVETLGGAVIDAASTLATEAASGTDAVSRTPDAPGPARHVDMAVDLQDYGIVNVRLTVVGEALTLRLSAEHADTARRLEHEREALGAILSRAGYDADIRPVDRTPPPAAAAATPDGFAQAGGSAPFNDPNGSRRADPGQPQPRAAHFPEQSDADEAGRAGARRVGALYV